VRPRLDPSDLAKAWLVELIERAPLEDAARLPIAEFTRAAPKLCAAVLAALTDDAALDDLPRSDWDVEALRQVTSRMLLQRLDHITSRLADTPPPQLEAVLKGQTEPFTLIAAELTWQHADQAAIDKAAAALTERLRPGDQLLQADRGRWWLIAPGTDARERIADLSDGTLAFGLAACPHDGADPEALIAHADEALFRARAGGLPVQS
jgi:GGDEF domain-containing protein